LLPVGVDPHSYEPTPSDIRKAAESQVIIANGAGFEGFIEELVKNAGGKASGHSLQLITASEGLTSRQSAGAAIDPHFWLDPTLAVRYVENIRQGLSQADPAGAEVYAKNAEAYTEKLMELDGWIKTKVEGVPPKRRLLVTNQESFGYFADRYGFTVIGAITPSVSASASPSAQELAALVDNIRQSGAPAVFLETGSNPQLAQQLTAETGIQIAPELYTHSLSNPDGPAPTYIQMMEYDTEVIVGALAQ
jgi:ABC-type Zn uptake system ZnuABC Zn-binding protein ZnuA